MDKDIGLYCTQDDDGACLVRSLHPFGGMNVLETFDNQTEAQDFLATADGFSRLWRIT